MGTGAVGKLTLQSGGLYSGGGSKNEIESRIGQLEKKRDDLLKQKEISDTPELEKKLGEIEKKLSNLQTRLDRIKTDEEQDDGECETCKNRKYQDGSDDPGVSFKMATKVSPGSAEAAVRGHENEHVMRNQAKAAREDKEIVFQSVTIQRAICPECGKSYVAGGETRTVTRSKPERSFDVGLYDPEKGKNLDIVA